MRKYIALIGIACILVFCLSAAAETAVVPVKTLKITTRSNTPVLFGRPLQIQYQTGPENATDPSLAWSSSDEGIATVDEQGTVTAVSAGKVTITAETRDGSRKKARVALYVPSLSCETEEIVLNRPQGASIELYYSGEDWDRYVRVYSQKACFRHAEDLDGNRVTVRLYPAAAGTDRLTITNKKDSRSKITISVTVTEEALVIPEELVITGVTCSDGRAEITMFNGFPAVVAECRFHMIPYGVSGEQLYYSDGTPENINNEYRFFRQTIPLPAGETRSESYNLGQYYEGIDHLDVAVDYIRMGNGTVIEYSDSGRRWFSSLEGDYTVQTENQPENCYPGRELLDRAGSFRLGYSSMDIWEELAGHYGYHHAGSCVEEVAEDSAADLAGLRPGDLIYMADGVLFADDPYIIEKAKIRMLDGDSVTLTAERPGQDEPVELVLSR